MWEEIKADVWTEKGERKIHGLTFSCTGHRPQFWQTRDACGGPSCNGRWRLVHCLKGQPHLPRGGQWGAEMQGRGPLNHYETGEQFQFRNPQPARRKLGGIPNPLLLSASFQQIPMWHIVLSWNGNCCNWVSGNEVSVFQKGSKDTSNEGRSVFWDRYAFDIPHMDVELTEKLYCFYRGKRWQGIGKKYIMRSLMFCTPHPILFGW